MECMRSLPLAFGNSWSGGASDLAREYSWEPKKGLCILFFSLSWTCDATTSEDCPSYWTTSADSHLCE